MFDSVFRFRDSISGFSCHSVERPWERGMNWKSAKKYIKPVHSVEEAEEQSPYLEEFHQTLCSSDQQP